MDTKVTRSIALAIAALASIATSEAEHSDFKQFLFEESFHGTSAKQVSFRSIPKIDEEVFMTASARISLSVSTSTAVIQAAYEAGATTTAPQLRFIFARHKIAKNEIDAFMKLPMEQGSRGATEIVLAGEMVQVYNRTMYDKSVIQDVGLFSGCNGQCADDVFIWVAQNNAEAVLPITSISGVIEFHLRCFGEACQENGLPNFEVEISDLQY